MNNANPSSMRRAIRQRQQQTFVGRGVELDTFRRQLTLAADDPRRYFVLNVYGEGGVGKTTLLGAFARLGVGQGAAVALSDDGESDAPAAMARLAEQLADALPGGDPCHAFAERYRTYRQKRAELEADPDAPTGLAGLFGRAAVKVGARALRNVAPGADLVLGFVEDPLAEQAGQWAEFVRRKLGNRDEAQLVLEPEVALTPLFVQGVRAVAAARPVALLFDTYERTADFLDGWLRALLDFRHGDLPDNLTLVIAGRQPLDRNAWAALEGVIAPLCLEPFDEAEARDYLSRRGVANEAVVDVILTLSGRLPLLLMLLANQSPDDPAQVGDTTGTAVERFLKWVDDPARRALALNGALPRRLNRDVAVLLGGDDAFDWLVANRLIERKGDGEAWTYHEVVREQMLRYKHAEAPGEWAMLHERLAEHYEKARDGLGLSWAEGARNKAWREAALEALYHRLCARPDKHLAEAVNEFVAALDGRWVLARPWAGTLAAAGKDAEHGELKEWGRALRAGLEADDDNRYEDARAMYDRLLEWPRLEVLRRPIVLRWRGETYRLMDEPDKALADLDRAIDLDSHYAWAIASRGQVYRALERYGEALADLSRALEIDPSLTWAVGERGHIYRLTEAYDKALADFDQAIVIDPKYIWAIAGRGQTYQQMGEYDKALADFDRAIVIDPKYIWAIGIRGETYRQTGEYDKALADFDRAIDLDPQYAWPIASRGETYRQTGEYDKALADFNRAIGINPKYTWAIAHRGETYRQMSEYDKALADFGQAIDLDPQYAWAIANRGETYRQTGEYDKALIDFDQAIELQPNDAWAIASRGQVYQSMNRYNEALVAFSQALEIDSSLDWALIERGETYQLMGAYAQALADLDKAIDLNLKHAWPIAGRGETYRLMGEYAKALNDFDRAIDLDPQYAWAIVSRAKTYLQMGESDKARADIDRVGALAEDDYRADPTDLQNLFNLALYRVAQGDAAAAEALYCQGLAAGPTAPTLHDAIRDLDELIRFFPGNELAGRLRALLTAEEP